MKPVLRSKTVQKISRFLLKSLVLSLIIFLANNFLLYVAQLIVGRINDFNYFPYYLIYIFFYFFIIYYVLILSYGLIRMKTSTRNYLIAVGISVAGYFLYRFGDILDGDFSSKFSSVIFLIFPITGILLGFLGKRLFPKILSETQTNLDNE